MGDDPCDPCPAFLLAADVPIFIGMSDGEWVPPAHYHADDLGLPVARVRDAYRRFRDMGLAKAGALFREDDGKICGRGTWLNRHGLLVRDALERAQRRPVA